MHKTLKLGKLVTCLLFLLIFGQIMYSQSFESGFYRLTTQWQGDGRSLDVVNDGVNNKLQLAASGNFSGQFWRITPVGDGFYRLTTQWLGEKKSLDIINDGANNKLILADSGNAAGQLWKITSLGNGFYRLTTKWQGDGKSLDVVNDGANNKLQLAETGNFTGQFWKITLVSADKEIAATSNNLKQIYLSGFKIIVDAKLAEQNDTKTALKILDEKLAEIKTMVKPKHFEKLKTIPIYVQYKYKSDGAAWYHTDKNWLVSNGYPAEMENSVEIKNIRNFIDWQSDQPFMVLHELAHGFQDLYLANLQAKLTNAFEKAAASGKYESVPYIRGGKLKHYALTGEVEYFAELTEAYFGKNDYFPYNKEDLKNFDPLGYQLMQEAWE